MFSNMDFFGDPMWPVDYEVEKKKVDQFQQFRPKMHIKRNLSEEKQQFQESGWQLSRNAKDIFNFDGQFQLNQEKMDYSNLKHSEVTYLDDNNKMGFLYEEDDSLVDNIQGISTQRGYLTRQRKRINQQSPQDEKQQDCIEQRQFGYEKSLRNHLPLNQKNREKKTKKPKNLICSFKQAVLQLLKIESKQQNHLIEELLDGCSLMKEEEKKLKMRKVEKQILKKLQWLGLNSGRRENQTDKIDSSHWNNKAKPKSNRYKILTQSEKQFLVFLSSQLTTCEVARRFNISVNNISRWKKGCARKVGAGRKITNQELQEKIIDFIKNEIRDGVILTRKMVQQKAMQYSQDKNFKASKGWLERFYNRNKHIFIRPQQEDKTSK